MCDDLKREFYAACPVWYWPVLWWQFVVMERRLAALYAARGLTDMTYGLALGPQGQLRLVFLSDAVRSEPCLADHALTLICPQAEGRPQTSFARFQVAPVRAALASSHLYLDPG